MAQGTHRIGVSERRKPLTRGLGRETRIAGIEPRDRLQQRAVEELLVDTPHLARMAPPLSSQLGDRVGAEAQGPADPAKGDLILRHDVRAPQLMQLDAML